MSRFYIDIEADFFSASEEEAERKIKEIRRIASAGGCVFGMRTDVYVAGEDGGLIEPTPDWARGEPYDSRVPRDVPQRENQSNREPGEPLA